MSLLAEKLRGVLFSNLRPDMPLPVRSAAWDLFNAIDTDLDIAEYTNNESSTTQEAAERFDDVLKRGDEIEDDIIFEEDEEEEEVTPRNDPLEIELDDDELT